MSGHSLLSRLRLYLLKTHIIYSPVPNKVEGFNKLIRGSSNNKIRMEISPGHTFFFEGGGIKIIKRIKRETVIAMDDF